jgi:tetratricopeptide (TPR) repeat protein
LGRWDEAEVQCRKALNLGEELVADSPNVTDNVVAHARSCVELGNLLHRRGEPREALDWYAKAVKILEAPQQAARTREELRYALDNRAEALDRLGQYAEAIASWERALELDNGQFRGVLQLGRAISVAHRDGDHRQALAEAGALASDGHTLERQARLCAQASAPASGSEQEPPEAAQLHEQYAARAVELLWQAAGKGHRDILYLKEGADLAPLRSRADFRKLLAELVANQETARP